MTRVYQGLAKQPLEYIVENMRDVDRREIFCTRYDSDTDRFVEEMMETAALPGVCFTCTTDDGEPVSVLGFVEKWPGVANVWAFGTDLWPSAVKTMTKVVRKVIIPSLVAGGVHRAECAALEERADTAKWLPMLGMRKEAVFAGFGSRREDFALYVWRPEHVHQPKQRRQEGAQVPETAGSTGREGRSCAQSAA